LEGCNLVEVELRDVIKVKELKRNIDETVELFVEVFAASLVQSIVNQSKVE